MKNHDREGEAIIGCMGFIVGIAFMLLLDSIVERDCQDASEPNGHMLESEL